MRPTADLPARAVLVAESGAEAALDVVDVSVGGLALSASAPLAGARPGERVRVRVALGPFGEHALDTVVRWVGDGVVGVEALELAPAALRGIGRYVAELLTRGAPS